MQPNPEPHDHMPRVLLNVRNYVASQGLPFGFAVQFAQVRPPVYANVGNPVRRCAFLSLCCTHACHDFHARPSGAFFTCRSATTPGLALTLTQWTPRQELVCNSGNGPAWRGLTQLHVCLSHTWCFLYGAASSARRPCAVLAITCAVRADAASYDALGMCVASRSTYCFSYHACMLRHATWSRPVASLSPLTPCMCSLAPMRLHVCRPTHSCPHGCRRHH